MSKISAVTPVLWPHVLSLEWSTAPVDTVDLVLVVQDKARVINHVIVGKPDGLVIDDGLGIGFMGDMFCLLLNIAVHCNGLWILRVLEERRSWGGG